MKTKEEWRLYFLQSDDAVQEMIALENPVTLPEVIELVQRDCWQSATKAQMEESVAEMKSIECDITLVSLARFPGDPT